MGRNVAQKTLVKNQVIWHKNFQIQTWEVQRTRGLGLYHTNPQEQKTGKSTQTKITKKPSVSVMILFKISQRQVFSGAVSSRKTNVP